MARARKRLSLLVLAALGWIGCVDFDYLQSGLAAAPAPAPVDGGPDTATDTGVPGDAATSFCTGRSSATVCEDFDRATPLEGWTPRVSLGRVEPSPVRSRSAPTSFLATLPRRETARERATIGRTFDRWRRVVLEADVYLEPARWQAGDVNAAVLMVELLSEGGAVAGQFVVISEPNSQLTGLASGVGPALPSATWMRLRFDFDPTGSAEVAMDGRVLARAPVTGVPATSVAPGMRVSLGINGINAPAPELTAYFDNVTIDLP